MVGPTVCVKPLRACVFGAAAAGIPPNELLARLDLDPMLLADPHARVPHATLVRAWELVPQQCGDESFGLHTAQRVVQQPFDVIDYVMRQSTSGRELVERLVRYQRLIHDAHEIRLEADGDGMALRQRFLCAPPAPRHLVEFFVGLWVMHGRRAFGDDYAPTVVRFQHSTPADLTEHKRLFRARLCFGAEDNGLTFPAHLMDAPIPQGDPSLGVLLDRQAHEMLARLPQAGSFLEELRRHLCAELPSGEPDLSSTARKLRLSPRSLQRRLRQEHTSFLALVDDLRRELAVGYLRDRGLTLCEIGFLLGFVEQSSFFRAFRRWTGSTPAEYRNRQGDQARPGG